MPFPEPFHLPLRRGRRFCVRYSARGAAKGSLLFVHAFAEEMNKSRRMVALQSRAFAGLGFSVLHVDLYGCGDSDGDFGEADWSQWRSDVIDAARWWRGESGYAPILWSMRAGCLLACEAASVIGSDHLIFWQPQPTGAQVLQQFLRLRVAQQTLGSSTHPRAKTQDLRDALVRGEALEVAGYVLAPGLALGLESANLSLPQHATRAAWIEIVPDADTGVRPLAQSRINDWRNAGVDATLHSVQGPQFWQTQEIAESHALIEVTAAIVGGWSR